MALSGGETLKLTCLKAGLAAALACSAGAAEVLSQRRSAPQEIPQFVDVTRQAGIDFKHSMGADRLTNILQSSGAGVGFLDYDDDGLLDIYCVNGALQADEGRAGRLTNRLYRNNGDGTFTDVTMQSGTGDAGFGQGCLFGDYDNDGDTDIYITNYGPNVLYRNNGDATFSDVSQAAGVAGAQWSTGAAFGDYDGDGDIDLYVTNYLDFQIGKKAKKSRLSDREGYRFFPGPRDYAGQPDVLYRNNGDGTFTDVTRQAGVFDPRGKGMQAIFADFDDDGDADLFVANDRTQNFLYMNQGDGTFREIALSAGVGFDSDGNETGAMGVACRDFDGDGRPDLLVTNMVFEYNSLLRNRGDGSFEDLTRSAKIAAQTYPFVGWGVDLFDSDNDGDVDIAVANGHVQDYVDVFSESVTFAQPNLLFANDGHGRFRDVSGVSGKDFQTPAVSRGLATGDYDNDGDTDILISNLNTFPALLRNELHSSNRWIMVRVIGRQSNRDGLGAKVRVVTGELSQSIQVWAASSYLSQNDRRLKFGLGARRSVDLLEVRWPAGGVDRFREVGTNRLVIVTEGEGMRSVEFR